MTEIPKYPPVQPLKKIPVEDPVARSLARPDACAKPATMGSKVRVRVTQGDKSLKRKKKRGARDKRDVNFY